jgi:NitT/TauT family transport system ATP-binding protein
MAENGSLIAAESVSKTYQAPDHAGRLVLDHIDFALKEGEIVAILGKSGSGKSTFLRVLAGLTTPSEGRVTYRGHEVAGPAQGIAMVFQTFALFPWLTVLGNVELGLEAQGVPRGERRERALKAIDVIGLDGFESAYPKELSGGMRQRVGFARALVVNPDILLLDEPFSALDVLTAETLRGDLIDLWTERRVPTKGIILVSHNIEEAVEMADRIIVFGSDPGRIAADLADTFPSDRRSGLWPADNDAGRRGRTARRARRAGRRGRRHRLSHPERLDPAAHRPHRESVSASLQRPRRLAPSRRSVADLHR